MAKWRPVVSERSLRVEISSMTMSSDAPATFRPAGRRTIGRRARRRIGEPPPSSSRSSRRCCSRLLFGAIDYGLYFADAMTVQQGVADAARDATLSVGSVSANWPGRAPAPSPRPPEPERDERPRQMACSLSDSTQPIGGGVVMVKAEVVTPAGDADGRVGAGEPAPGVRDDAAQCRPPPRADAGRRDHQVEDEMPIQPGLAPLWRSIPSTQDAGVAGGDWTWC